MRGGPDFRTGREGNRGCTSMHTVKSPPARDMCTISRCRFAVCAARRINVPVDSCDVVGGCRPYGRFAPEDRTHLPARHASKPSDAALKPFPCRTGTVPAGSIRMLCSYQNNPHSGLFSAAAVSGASSRSLATPSGSSPRDEPGNRKGTVAGALKFLERATGLEPASVSLGS